MLSKKSQSDTSPTPTSGDGADTSNTSPQLPSSSDGKEKDANDLAPAKTTASQEGVYPSGPRLAFILISVFASMFLVALDRLIITTAIPKISDEFKSVKDIGWYGSAYFLTTCAFQLLFGKLYTYFSIKAVFLASVLLFEIGSAVCGAAPTSVAFIVGRAIAGVGGSGIMTGGIMVIVHALPLHKRPLYQGFFGAVFGVASVVGPLLGGVFTSKVTWRWCFYINLPLGGVALVIIFFLLDIKDQKTTNLPLKEKLSQLDVYGSGLILPASVCLVLVLQWGGITYAWNDGRIIALLVLVGVLWIGFVLVQVYLPKTATIAPRVLKQRSVFSGFLFTIVNGSHMVVYIYYLPIWFQAIKGVSAYQSGIRTLPLVLGLVFASILCGALINRVGYYTPFMYLGVCLMCVGAGLLYTLQVDTPAGKWIGYQLIYGLGLGLSSQIPNIAAQTVLEKKDIPSSTALLFFAQLLGGTIFVSVAENIFEKDLIRRLSSIPGLSPQVIEDNGATSLVNLPESIKGAVLVQYNESLRRVFLLGLILACLTVIGAAGMEWKTVRKNVNKQKGKAEEDGTAQVGDKREIGTQEESIAKKSREKEDERASTASGNQSEKDEDAACQTKV